jgi:hypothetical protein
MVSVLAIGPKVHGIKTSRRNGYLRMIKIRSTPTFGVGIKTKASCLNILRHVKKTLASINKNILQGQILIPFSRFPCLLPDDSTGRIAKEVYWTNKEFSPVDTIPPWVSMLIYHQGNKQQTCWWLKFRDVVSLHRHHRQTLQQKRVNK